MTHRDNRRYVTRAGQKLEAALLAFRIDVRDAVCADLGSHAGGFVDCLLQHGAARVYSVDTSYGTLDYRLRTDERVVVVERTNAMHVVLAEPVSRVTIDVGWTPQRRVLPNVRNMVTPDADVITLIKPHYEAPRDVLDHGVLPHTHLDPVLTDVLNQITQLGWQVLHTTVSPLPGHGGNREVLAHLRYAARPTDASTPDDGDAPT